MTKQSQMKRWTKNYRNETVGRFGGGGGSIVGFFFILRKGIRITRGIRNAEKHFECSNVFFLCWSRGRWGGKGEGAIVGGSGSRVFFEPWTGRATATYSKHTTR